jgi:hypothetical protein
MLDSLWQVRVHANFVGTLEEEREDIPDKKRKSPQTRKEGAKR